MKSTIMRFGLLFAALLVCFISKAQECEFWTGSYGNIAVDPAVDEEGNIYVWDNYFNFLEGKSVFLIKYSPTGEILFKKDLDISDTYFKTDLVVKSGSLYFVGTFRTLNLSGGLVEAEDNSMDGIVIKFDTDGNQLWAKVFTSNTLNRGQNLTASVIDNQNNLYVSGFFDGPVIIDGVEYESNIGRSEKWLGYFKFDTEGNLLWHRASKGDARIFTMKLDAKGLIVSAGRSTSSEFSVGGLSTINGGSRSMIINKFDEQGNFLWMYTLKGEVHNSYDIATVGSDTYFLGDFDRPVTIDGNLHEPVGTGDGIVGKLDNSGKLQWYNTFGGLGEKEENSFEGWGGIGMGSDGNVYIGTPLGVNEDNTVRVSNQGTVITKDDRSKKLYLLSYNSNSGAFISARPLAFNYNTSSLRGFKINNDNIFYTPNSDSDIIEDNGIYVKTGAALVKEPLFTNNSNKFNLTFIEPKSTLVPIGESILLQAEGNSISSIQWYKDDKPIENAIELTYNALETGFYNAKYVNNNGCETTALRSYNLTFYESGLTQDSLALVDFYTRAPIHDWSDTTNWLTGPISTWYGVTVEEGRVTKLELSNNNLFSFLTMDFSRLDKLKVLDLSDNDLGRTTFVSGLDKLPNLHTLDLSGNNLEDIPDMRKSTSLINYDVRDNAEFTYLELVPNIEIENFSYDSNDYFSSKCFIIDDLDHIKLEPLLESKKSTLVSNLGVEFTNYVWKKDGEILNHKEPYLNITNLGLEDIGTYSLEVTNEKVTGVIFNFEFSLSERQTIFLPTVENWEGEGETIVMTIEEGELVEGAPIFTTRTATINANPDGIYEISDVSGGFYNELFMGAFPDIPVIIAGGCADGAYEVIKSTIYSDFTSDGIISWNQTEKELIVPWKDRFNRVKGVSTFTYQGDILKENIISLKKIENPTLGSDIILEATASSSLDVSFEIIEGNEIAFISGNTLSAYEAGIVTVRATQAGNFEYNPAVPVEQTLIVTRGKPSITISNLEHEADGSIKEAIVTADPDNLTVLVSYNGSYDPPINGGIYEVLAIAYDDDYYGYESATMKIASDPEVIESIEDISIEEGSPSFEIDLTTIISDADGDELTFTVSIDNNEIATVSLDGNTLIVTELKAGEAIVTITATDENGNEVTTSFKITIIEVPVTAIDQSDLVKVKVFPNPAKNELNITGLDSETTIALIDLNGQVKLEIKTSQNVNLNLSEVSSGIYILEISNRNINQHMRLVKN